MKSRTRKSLAGLALLIAISLLAADPALAQDNIAKSLLGSFVGQTDNWWGILRGYALFLFTTTLILEVCLFGVRIALQRADIAETISQFVHLLLFAGFVATVIMNYQEWATGIAVKGLQPLTGQLTGNAVDAGQPVALAAAIMEKMVPVMEDAGILDFGEVYLYVTCLLIIMVIFVLISALIILVTCEFYIVANVGVLLIGLGGSKLFKEYAINVMRYILAVAVKLFVLQLIVNIGFAIISLSDLDATVGSTLKTIKFTDLFFLIGKAIILLALAKSLPDTCAGIINGSSVSSGNPIAGLARTAGTMAVGAVSGGVGYAAGLAQAGQAAHSIAKQEGAVGLGATVSGMARAFSQARRDAKAGNEEKALQSEPGSVKNQLISRANSLQALRLLDSGADSISNNAVGTAGQASRSETPDRLPTPDALPGNSGGSGTPTPSASSLSSTDGVGVPDNSSAERTALPKTDFTPPKPKGPVDMRNYNIQKTRNRNEKH